MIESILNLVFPYNEYIVLNDVSTDTITEVLENYAAKYVGAAPEHEADARCK